MDILDQKLDLKAQYKMVWVIDWFDLDKYLRQKYNCQGTHIPEESGNDRDFYFSGIDGTDQWNGTVDSLGMYKNGTLAWYYMSDFLNTAVRDGHLRKGNYCIKVSW